MLLVFVPYDADQREKTAYRMCGKLLMQQLKGIDTVITVKRLFPKHIISVTVPLSNGLD